MASSSIAEPRALEILAFWFDEPSGELAQLRKVWFQKNTAFDEQIRQRFLTDYEKAATGQLETWKTHPKSCLALILLLDQFPRNLFRQNSRSFATDKQAVAVAQWAIDQGFNQSLIPVEQLFVYLPFEHSEQLTNQHRAVTLIEPLGEADPGLVSCVDYAYRHRDVIERFGRFPHRNEILGRSTTLAEAEFLRQPGSRF
ncbi:MAG: DUF924 family protein [Cyanobacteria bacterium P01_A01_bin.123]